MIKAIAKKGKSGLNRSSRDTGGGGEGHRVVHKLSKKPTGPADANRKILSSHVTLLELYSPGQGKAEGTGVRIAESGGQDGEAKKTRIVTEKGGFSLFLEAGEEEIAYTGGWEWGRQSR